MARPLQPRMGGSFAPPLTADKIAEYRELAKQADPKVGSVMESLCTMVETFQQTPASTNGGRPHPSGRGTIVALEQKEIERIDPVVPWDYEVEAYQKLFDELPTGTIEGPMVLMEQHKDGTSVVAASIPQKDAAGRFIKSEGVNFYYKTNQILVNPQEAALRNAAFHLLWFAKELELDREPITADMI